MGRWSLLGAMLGLLSGCVRTSYAPPAPSEPPEPPTPIPVRWSLTEVQAVPGRLTMGETGILGSYFVTVREVNDRGRSVEVTLTMRRGSAEEIERQKAFNPLFLSASGEAGIGVGLLAVEDSSPERLSFRVLFPSESSTLCHAGGGEPPGWEASGRCRFEVPPGAVPAYLIFTQWRQGASLFIPFPMGDVGDQVLMPLPALPPVLTGRVPDLPIPPGAPLRTPGGLEVIVLDARITRQGLPVVDEATGSVGGLGAGEGSEWVVVRLQARCMRKVGCEASFFLSDPGSGSSPPRLIGPVPGHVDPRALPHGVEFDPEHPVLYRFGGGVLMFPEGEEAIRVLAFAVPVPAARYRVLEMTDSESRPYFLMVSMGNGRGGE